MARNSKNSNSRFYGHGLDASLSPSWPTCIKSQQSPKENPKENPKEIQQNPQGQGQRRLIGGSMEINRYGRPLKGTRQRSGALDGGSLAMPRMVNLTKHSIKDITDYAVPGYEETFTLIEPIHRDKESILNFHDFNGRLPVYNDVVYRAEGLADIAKAYSCKYAWIGGTPYLSSVLSAILIKCSIVPVFSWSVRDYNEVIEESGKVRMEMYRQHAGWVVLSC